jgi:glycosyltransferase involved in cell wall biosynthesis
MKICIFSIVTYWHGVKGGMEIHGKILCEGLVKRGHEVTVISTRHPDGKEYEEVNGIKIYYLTKTGFSTYWKKWGKESLKKFDQLNMAKFFDIVFSQSFSGYYFAINKRKYRIPFVSFLHGAGPYMTIAKIKLALHRQHISIAEVLRTTMSYIAHYSILHLPTVLGSDLIICASNHVRDSVRKWYPVRRKKIYTIMNGIDTFEFSPNGQERNRLRKRLGIREGEFLLMTSGSISKEKGHHLAVEALNKLLKKNVNLKLMIVGDGEYLASLSGLIDKFGLKDRVILTGFVPNESISNYYNAADIYLIPTLRAEGLPFALIEAMSIGLPIIASRMGGIPDVVENGKEGLLVNPDDTNDMVSKILTLLRNKNLRKELGARARSKVLNELNSENMITRTLRIIESKLFDISNGASPITYG